MLFVETHSSLKTEGNLHYLTLQANLAAIWLSGKQQKTKKQKKACVLRGLVQNQCWKVTQYIYSSIVLKGVVHPQNDFFSIDYSPHGDLRSIIFLVFGCIHKTKNHTQCEVSGGRACITSSD